MRTCTKNLALSAAVTMMTALALSACGGEAPPPETPAPPPPPPPADTAAATPPPADTTPPPPPKPALADVIPQVVKSMNDAFNAHDATKLAGFTTDDVAAYSYGAGETHSRGDLTTGTTTFFTMFPDVKGMPLRVWIKDHVAVQELAWTGTMKGGSKPAGGMMLQVMTFNDDGLIKEMHEYGDDAGMMMQVAGKKGAPPIPTLPSNPAETHVAKGTPDEDKLVAWAKSVDDAFNKDDPKAVLGMMADDADYWMNIGGGPATHGKKDNQKALTAWFKTMPDQKWTATNVWGIDGFAIVEHTVSGTAKGPMGGMPASNKPVQSWHWVDIMQPTADGKIQHGWGYANTNELLAQTGQLKMPPSSDKAKAPPAKKP